METTNDLFQTYYADLSELLTQVQECQRLRANSNITEAMAFNIVSACFLRAYTDHEAFLESTFLKFISKGVSGHPAVQLKVQAESYDVAFKLICGEKFGSWLPYNHTSEISKLYFQDSGNPFLQVVGNKDEILRSASIVRNAIAHKSDSARRKFSTLVEREVPSSIGCQPHEFLLFAHNATTKIEHYFSGFNNVARTILGLSLT